MHAGDGIPDDENRMYVLSAFFVFLFCRDGERFCRLDGRLRLAR